VEREGTWICSNPVFFGRGIVRDKSDGYRRGGSEEIGGDRDLIFILGRIAVPVITGQIDGGHRMVYIF
jgi:hypothetical protein